MEAVSRRIDFSRRLVRLQKALKEPWGRQVPLLLAILVLVLLWDLLTSRLRLLPLPYFPAPGEILFELWRDRSLLGLSIVHSLRLLGLGYLAGTLAGLGTGILMGWFRQGEYWLQPVLRFMGPIPAPAWIPLAMVLFPNSFSASIFLLALSAWFPATILTWSGVAGVNRSYLEVARTLGAGGWALLWKVAIPAALPSIFVGLFMGLGLSFATLVVAEMLGVRAGLGWYVQWAQGWAEYDKVYGALLIMALLFSTLLTVIFRFRDRFLAWQRGLIRW